MPFVTGGRYLFSFILTLSRTLFWFTGSLRLPRFTRVLVCRTHTVDFTPLPHVYHRTAAHCCRFTLHLPTAACLVVLHTVYVTFGFFWIAPLVRTYTFIRTHYACPSACAYTHTSATCCRAPTRTPAAHHLCLPIFLCAVFLHSRFGSSPRRTTTCLFAPHTHCLPTGFTSHLIYVFTVYLPHLLPSLLHLPFGLPAYTRYTRSLPVVVVPFSSLFRPHSFIYFDSVRLLISHITLLRLIDFGVGVVTFAVDEDFLFTFDLFCCCSHTTLILRFSRFLVDYLVCSRWLLIRCSDFAFVTLPLPPVTRSHTLDARSDHHCVLHTFTFYFCSRIRVYIVHIQSIHYFAWLFTRCEFTCCSLPV